jgi:hypothetical protein
MSWSTEVTVGELRPWPDAVAVIRCNAGEARRYVPERTATHMIVNNGITGHSACTGCGKAIDPWDEWCRHCGARLEGGWK